MSAASMTHAARNLASEPSPEGRPGDRRGRYRPVNRRRDGATTAVRRWHCTARADAASLHRRRRLVLWRQRPSHVVAPVRSPAAAQPGSGLARHAPRSNTSAAVLGSFGSAPSRYMAILDASLSSSGSHVTPVPSAVDIATGFYEIRPRRRSVVLVDLGTEAMARRSGRRNSVPSWAWATSEGSGRPRRRPWRQPGTRVAKVPTLHRKVVSFGGAAGATAAAS